MEFLFLGDYAEFKRGKDKKPRKRRMSRGAIAATGGGGLALGGANAALGYGLARGLHGSRRPAARAFATKAGASGAIGGALLGYGAYRGAKALMNRRKRRRAAKG